MNQPHLVVGIDEVLRRLGGTARRWRVDPMATVIVPGTDQVQASFAPVASITASVSIRARRGTATARGSWRGRSTI
jgi:hypothetical protein